jgi:hypothetical protein
VPVNGPIFAEQPLKYNIVHLQQMFLIGPIHDLVVPTLPPHSAHITTQDILNIYTERFNFSTLILIINIPQDVWIVENIFMNNYTLD